jgi:hypothetical protein
MELLYEHTIRHQDARIAALEAQNATLEAQNAEITARQGEIMGMMRQLTTHQNGGELAITGGTPIQHAAAGEVAIQNADQGLVAVDNRKMITINIFGQEGLDHVTAAEVKRILDETLQTHGLALPVRTGPTKEVLPAVAAEAAVLKMAMLIYSDPARPENLTCYLPNKKTNEALVHGENGWEVCPTALVLPPMAEKSVRQLFAKQPYENIYHYDPLIKALRDNAQRFASGVEMRPIIVRNKDLLQQALKELPLAGKP